MSDEPPVRPRRVSIVFLWLSYLCFVSISFRYQSKKAKKEKKDKKDKPGAEEQASASVDIGAEVSYEQRLKAVSPISTPMANEKLTKKLHKLVKKASGVKGIRRGVKEVIKALRKVFPLPST